MPGIQFGYCLPIFAAPGVGLFRTPAYVNLDPRATLALGVLADSLGYDSLWVADHLMLGQDDAILEGWTTISALAGATRSAKLGMIHQANLLRNPAVAAKMAATLDQLSGGRLIHFPDFGNNRREHIAYGAPWPDDADARIAQFWKHSTSRSHCGPRTARSTTRASITKRLGQSATPNLCSDPTLRSGSAKCTQRCSTPPPG